MRRGGATLAIPQPSKCMLCHAAIATDKPDIKHLADAAKADEGGASYQHGTDVQLVAFPAVNWSFTGWTGDCAAFDATP